MLQHLLFLRPSIEGISVTTENLIFKLIYAVSCPIFLSFGVLFYTRVCFTDPINCVSNSTESFKVLRAIDSYCLENSYIVQQDLHSSLSSEQDANSIQIETIDTDQRIYQSNYQYVGLFFVLCGAFCYIPYILWEWFENGLLKSLLQDLMSVIDPEKDSKWKQIIKLSDFWKTNRIILKTYANANILCEVLNFVSILFLFFLTNDFLYGNFVTFGVTPAGNGETRNVFPKSTNCSWNTVGPSGKSIIYEGVCTMNLNFLSEKMFYFSWWWIVSTMTLCSATLAYRYLIYKNAHLRSWIIINGNSNFLSGCKLLDKNNDDETKNDCLERFESYLVQISYGEFFMLKRIQANVTSHTFMQILQSLKLTCSSKEPNKAEEE